MEKRKGYGRITADDGEVLFASFAQIVGEGFRELGEGDHGRHAADEVRAE